jgi:hypothetical protein
MKHIGPASLGQLSELLVEIRRRDALKERSPAVFYLKSRAFLHFHEDPAGLFADLRAGTAFDRLPVNTPADRAAFLAALDRALES